VSGVIGNTVISIVVGSVYYNISTDTDGMDKRAILLFFSLMINAYAPAFDVRKIGSFAAAQANHGAGVRALGPTTHNRETASLCLLSTIYRQHRFNNMRLAEQASNCDHV
jgi:hypothetical protein